MSLVPAAPRILYWRRELPPLHEEVEGEHEIEAESRHVPNDYAHRAELWGRCYPSLIEEAERRIQMEVARLGGSCAHVVDEQVVARVDDAAGEFSLRGRFRFVLYRHPAPH